MSAALDDIAQQVLLAIAEGIDTPVDLDLEYPYVSRIKHASRIQLLRRLGLITIGERLELTDAGRDHVAELGRRTDAA